MNIFNIHIEFCPEIFRHTVEDYIKRKQKAYVCVIDGSVISNAHRNLSYREIINGATINTCDGSSIAMMANRIYGTRYHAYNGPEIFEYYIEQTYKHLLIGNTVDKVNQIRSKVISKGIDIDLTHLDVPFVSIDQFNYESIAEQINKLHPDIIWVSLGNPKQEIFMSKILPFINSGIMFGIGAAFNFYTGDLQNNKKEIGGVRFIWLERLFKEPKKQWKRIIQYINVMPIIFWDEYVKSRR